MLPGRKSIAGVCAASRAEWEGVMKSQTCVQIQSCCVFLEREAKCHYSKRQFLREQNCMAILVCSFDISLSENAHVLKAASVHQSSRRYRSSQVISWLSLSIGQLRISQKVSEGGD